jgi:hypothetical protein
MIERELVAKKVESGEDTEIAETMLRALKGSLEVFESHRKVILSWGMIAGRKRPSPSQGLATAIGPAAKGAATRGGSHSQTPQDPCAGGDAGSAAN